MLEIHQMDSIDFLQAEKRKFGLIYIDPPFNTGKVRKLGNNWYRDHIENYIAWISEYLLGLYEVLLSNGSLFVHLDEHESHYVKVILDKIFGRASFQNEIIWSYDYGGRSKKRWPAKHDTIFWYTKDPKYYTFNRDGVERLPYEAPGLCGPEKAAIGKFPTDVWKGTIVPTMGKEKTGYPTQKPLWLLERIVKVHSDPGDLLLDCFAGSGSFGMAAAKNDRDCVLVDSNPEAIKVMQKRLKEYLP